MTNMGKIGLFTSSSEFSAKHENIEYLRSNLLSTAIFEPTNQFYLQDEPQFL